jgi:UDP-N-acetylmuramate: L-alanyl-gamma-D-glutamyl-meso-diaminopimelate ligase
LKEYEGALALLTKQWFYSPDAVKIKQLEEVTYDQIATAFNRKELFILIQLNLKRIYSIRI